MLSENQLICRILKKDPKAVRQLLDQYQNYIYTICHSVLRDQQEAEEATQDTFIKVIRALPNYVKKGKITTWMYSIAYRTSLDYIKKRKPLGDLNGFDRSDETEVHQQIEAKEKTDNVSKLIDQLSEQDAALIRMFYMEEMSIKDLADITELSESNIKVKLFRARKALSELAKNEEYFSEYIMEKA